MTVKEIAEVHECPCPSGLPSRRSYTETQYSTIKRRTGIESVPFLGLEIGVHKVRFYTEKKSIIRNVKVWYSMYGFAWIILKEDEQ